MIHIAAHEEHPEHGAECHAYTRSMYEAWDMLEGRLWPFLAAAAMRWTSSGSTSTRATSGTHQPYRVLQPGDPKHRPVRELLIEIWERYGRPLWVSETGTEDDERGPWLHYICGEVEAAMQAGVPVHGICLYPIINHLGWNDDRHCRNGLWDFKEVDGRRPIEEDYARALAELRPRIEQVYREAMEAAGTAAS
jgi:hypothetical protein